LDSPHGGGTQARQQDCKASGQDGGARPFGFIIVEPLVARGDRAQRRARPEGGVFKLTSAKKIAASMKQSAEHSSRRKTGTSRSALSLLTSISIAPARICRRRSAS
jgi:hypothetical protein